jgi:signal transduction histidine kinase
VQLDRTRNKKTGFGLGLAIVKRAIEWHGGAVSISESPQGGARFSATWPVNIPLRYACTGATTVDRATLPP